VESDLIFEKQRFGRRGGYRIARVQAFCAPQFRPGFRVGRVWTYPIGAIDTMYEEVHCAGCRQKVG
jgi:hypothetical protein